MLAEHWNGRRWALMKTPSPQGTVSATLRSVSCASRKACTAVGHSYFRPSQRGYYIARYHQGLAERWNGRRWAIRKLPVPINAPRQLSDRG
jgi:hypothetical protein